jgi:hypothetical protein
MSDGDRIVMKTVVAAAVVALATASGANAANVLFSQNFDSLPEGIPAVSVPGFTVTGTVDVVTNGNYGITCVGNTGACVDIDGTPGPGSLTTNSINYAAGRALTLSFDLSGNQRDLSTDDFSWTFQLAAVSDILDFACNSGFVGCPAPGDYFGVTTPGFYTEFVAGNRPWLTYSMTFTPTTSGSLTMTFLSTSADNVGPMLDNVLVSQVPEPASWAMLIAGFGLVGAAARRRRVVVAA